MKYEHHSFTHKHLKRAAILIGLLFMATTGVEASPQATNGSMMPKLVSTTLPAPEPQIAAANDEIPVPVIQGAGLSGTTQSAHSNENLNVRVEELERQLISVNSAISRLLEISAALQADTLRLNREAKTSSASLPPVPAVSSAKIETDEDKRAYASGVALAAPLSKDLEAQKSLGINLDMPPLLLGLGDALQNKPLRINDKEMQAIMSTMSTQLNTATKVLSDKRQSEGDSYRNAFKKEKGVTEGSHGVLYQVLSVGKGKLLSNKDTAEVLMTVTQPDGSVIDGSGTLRQLKRVKVDSVLPAITVGLEMLGIDGHLKMVVPPEEGYGEAGLPPDIPGNATLIFDIQVQSRVASTSLPTKLGTQK